MNTILQQMIALAAIIMNWFTPVQAEVVTSATSGEDFDLLHTIIAPAFAGAKAKAARLMAAKSSLRKKGNGEKTRQGNLRALERRTTVNRALRLTSSGVAIRHNHLALEVKVARRIRALAEMSANGGTLNARIKAKKRALIGKGFTAKAVKKNTYRRIAVGKTGTYAVPVVKTTTAVVVVKLSRLEKAELSKINRRILRLKSFHSWVRAQEGGWISRKGMERLVTLQAQADALVASTKVAA